MVDPTASVHERASIGAHCFVGAHSAVGEDSINPSGRTISQLLTDNGISFQDVDTSSNLSGLAVVGNAANTATQGAWQYSTDFGVNWYAVGTVGDIAGEG